MVDRVQDSLHPYINYLRNRLESLLSIVEFEVDGQTVEPDGFRLKDLNSWVFEKYNSPFENLGSFSSQCNLKCKFCYEEGNPLGYEKNKLSLKEAETRLRYYNKKENRGLPLFRQRIYKEPFTNKELISILKKVRVDHPESEVHLTTNGSLFTDELLFNLSMILPVNLCISLNSSDPDSREQLMFDKRSRKSINMIKKMVDYGLPYAGSIVAWPEIMEKDLVETIEFLDKHQARMIRITLPGYSKFYSKTSLFKTSEVWQSILDIVLPMRKELKTPVLVLPSLYHSPPFLPEIAGIIRNSPADRAGLKFGDILVTINGRGVITRTEAQEVLFSESQLGLTEIEFRRGDRIITEVLKEPGASVDYYPYRPIGYSPSKAHPMGIVLVNDMNPKWIVKLLKSLSELEVRNVLIMTSVIMEPLVESFLSRLPNLDQILGDKNLFLWIPKHRFWGGNIILGDLYTCYDYIQAVKDFKQHHSINPDLLVIPSSFSPNGYSDITGVSYSSIEHETGISVLLAKCSTVTM